MMRWLRAFVRHVRVSRYEHRRFEHEMRDRRSAEHLERARQGIKDPGPV